MKTEPALRCVSLCCFAFSAKSWPRLHGAGEVSALRGSAVALPLFRRRAASVVAFSSQRRGNKSGAGMSGTWRARASECAATPGVGVSWSGIAPAMVMQYNMAIDTDAQVRPRLAALRFLGRRSFPRCTAWK
jgi:hypothetical protein